MRKLKKIGFFKELNHGFPDGGSLKDLVSESRHLNHDKILKYLKDGELLIASPGLVKDVLGDSSEIIGSANVLTDGVWAWSEDLSYYFEKYNVSLVQNFLDHMEEKDWNINEVDLSVIEF